MKNSDEAVDRVLAGLREVEALVGMEARVLARMNAGAPPRKNWTWAWGLAAAGVALAVGVGVGVHQRGPRGEVARVPVVVSPEVAAGPTHREEQGRDEWGTGAVGSGRTAVDPTSARVRRVAVGPTHRVKQERDEWGTGVAASSRDEVSLVAPPMPLTDEEKLGVEVAQRGVERPVPVLNPDELARREAAAEVQFQQLVAQTVDVEQFVQITRKNGEKR